MLNLLHDPFVALVLVLLLIAIGVVPVIKQKFEEVAKINRENKASQARLGKTATLPKEDHRGKPKW